MKRLLRRLLAIALLTLLGWLVWSERQTIAAALTHLRWSQFGWILLATLPIYPLSVGAWFFLIQGLGGRLTYRQALGIWMLSNVARLLPGTVWQWVGRVYLAQSYGIPKSLTLLSVGYEVALLLVTSVMTILIGLPFWPVGFALPVWVSGLSLIALIGLWPGTLPRLVRLYSRVRRQPLGEIPPLPLAALLAAFACNMVRGVFNGLGLWFLVQFFQPIIPLEILGLAGAYTLAWLIGYVTILAPGGVGVADASLAGLVGARLTLAAGSTVALIFRVVLVLNELIVAGIAIILDPKVLSEVRQKR